MIDRFIDWLNWASWLEAGIVGIVIGLAIVGIFALKEKYFS